MAKSAAKKKDTIETHDFGTQTSKILQLMIHSLYENKDIFLRELVSNASDACDKLHYLSLTDNTLIADETEFKIHIHSDKASKILTITDNGIGMDKDELIENLGTIASSGTQRFFEQATGDSKKDIELIGQFGVGFYSSFMVADSILVVTRKAGTDQTWVWQSDGEGTFSIEPSEELRAPGTTIKLHLKEDAVDYLERFKLSHIIRTYSDHISYPVTFSEGHEEENEGDALNAGSALWTRQQKDITPEQYTEFYRHVGHLGDEPWLTLHNKVEGNLEYTNLLFVPTSKPFDLFHPDRVTRVKLYVKRVFIGQENIEIVPRYLRFVQGVVDSQDLPLNISRETLQHNHTLDKIRQSITKRVLNELKKKSEKDSEGYLNFWEQFGPVLKEGLCEGIDVEREKLLQLCLFYSSKSAGKRISLDSYIENMPEGQEQIYYLIGDNITALQNSPQLEGFKKRGIEVLLLNDPVDDFWVNTAGEYQGKEIVSLTRAGINFDEIDSGDETESENDKTKEKLSDKKKDALFSFLKETLKEQIHDAVESKKLSDSPVCLSAQDGAMDMRMERFLRSQNQLHQTSLKILEVNLSHPIITYLANHVEQNDAGDLAHLLFEQACVIEGEDLVDPGAFAARFNRFLQQALSSK